LFVTGTITTGLLWRGSSGGGALLMLSWQLAADACALLVQIGVNHREARLILSRPRLRRSLAVLKQNRQTVGALALSTIINAINQQLSISTVTFAFGATYAGWYSLAWRFVFLPCSIVSEAVSDVANQRLSRLHTQRRRFSEHVLRLMLGMAAVGAVPFAAIIFLAPALLPIIVGQQWIGAARSVSLLAVSAYLSFIITPAANVLLIVEARRYIVLWHTLRLAALMGLGAAALLGAIAYDTWLAGFVIVVGAMAYSAEGIWSWLFARHAEAEWLETPR
jgi:O-antigen/teichoic acid export membrane protein